MRRDGGCESRPGPDAPGPSLRVRPVGEGHQPGVEHRRVPATRRREPGPALDSFPGSCGVAAARSEKDSAAEESGADRAAHGRTAGARQRQESTVYGQLQRSHGAKYGGSNRRRNAADESQGATDTSQGSADALTALEAGDLGGNDARLYRCRDRRSFPVLRFFHSAPL